MPRHSFLVSVGLIAAVCLAACGEDEDSSEQPVAVTLRDYAFVGMPEQITVGTPITITNESKTEVHELTAFRLPDGETRPLSELIALPPEEFGALFPGAPALAMVATPGEEGEAVLGDGTLTEPGRYVVVCFIPTGADPDEVMEAMEAAATNPEAGPPEIAGGPPHFANGMITETEVTAASD